MNLNITTVDRHKGFVDITIYPTTVAEGHRIGYLRGEGWFCATCNHGTRCRLGLINTVKQLVPGIEEDQP